MKKLVLKYWPIPVALILAIVCSVCLSDYNKNRSEYAIVSYDSVAVAADISVSKTGKVVKVMPSDVESNEKLAEIDMVGNDIADAILRLNEYAQQNETVFVGAYIHEDTKVAPEDMKPILDMACSKLSASYLGTYGVYTSYDAQRSVSYNRTVGKLTYTKFYSNVFTNSLGQYMDSYLIYDSDPFEMVFFAKYLAAQRGVDNLDELFATNFSTVTASVNHIAEQEARNIATEFLRTTLAWEPDNLSPFSYRFDEGDLGYAYTFRYNGENRVVFVDVVNGSAREYYSDDL